MLGTVSALSLVLSTAPKWIFVATSELRSAHARFKRHAAEQLGVATRDEVRALQAELERVRGTCERLQRERG